MTCLAAALEYAKRGWLVFPAHWIDDKGKCSCRRKDCTSPGKHPLTEHGLKDASLNGEIIKTWWSKWSTANVGVCTGKESKLIVLDVDTPKGGAESIKKITSQYGNIPITLSVHTGGGGKHYFFEHPCNGFNYRNATNLKGFKGIDLRADGGYVIAAPSNHVSGDQYLWERYKDTKLQPLPGWLDILIKQENTPAWKPNGQSYWSKLWTGASEGTRNDTAAKLAGRLMGRGMAEEEVIQILSLWNLRNSPPMTENEVTQTVNSISRSESTKPQAIGCMSAEMFMTQEIERPPEIISGGIFMEGSGMLLIGESGVGKSLLTLEIAIRLSKGLPLWDMAVSKPYNVLFIQKENPEYTVQSRIRRICRGLNIISLKNITLADRKISLDLMRSVDHNNIKKLIEKSGSQIVVLDPLSSYHRANENDNIQMRQVLNNLTDISAQTGCAWIVVHHEGKPSDNKSTKWRFRGASSIRDWADTMIGYQHKPHNNKVLRTLTFDKIRHGPDRRGLILERDENFIHNIYDDDESNMIPMSIVAEVLQEMGGEGKKAQVVQKIKEYLGCSRQTAYRVIDKSETILWQPTVLGYMVLVDGVKV